VSRFPLLAFALAILAACSGKGTTPGPGAGSGTTTYDGGSTLSGGPMHTSSPCEITIDAPTLLKANHVMIPSPVAYDSNPPSSGSHYPIWAAYQEYGTPVDRRYYVHNEEHGGIVLLYNCDALDAGTCADLVRTLEAAANALPTDSLCTAAKQGVRVRTVITPDPLLDVPVAAAAWGWTYRAACADTASLVAFALSHYGQGPETICTNGTTQF
jgi:hypothetical protein